MALYLYKDGELDMIISGGRSDIDHWKDSYDRIVLLTSSEEEEFLFFRKKKTNQRKHGRDGH